MRNYSRKCNGVEFCFVLFFPSQMSHSNKFKLTRSAGYLGHNILCFLVDTDTYVFIHAYNYILV